ncbi:hypothetical protein GPECTOR_27g635 [Gonium pectorale]|uniref:Right handed beta helix domain-containing protein n=1 Tax=Gonium pectorale TaxID=33097 RepID=A0A150GFU5_GONPE|nr:hypothetical protein GPECTOR_27g635 [Gonium pectorale]|eukprot:KXZ48465.1 hypothetical protein GPECTOR_27g635 [Gonium pectorale]
MAPDLDEIRVTGYSTMSYNENFMRVGNAGLRRFEVSNHSHFDGNTNAQGVVQYNRIDWIEVSGNSSVLGNVPGNVLPAAAVFSTSSIGTFMVSSGGRIADNISPSWLTAGVLLASEVQSLIVTGQGSVIERNGAPGGEAGFGSVLSLQLLEVSDGARVAHNSAPSGNGGFLSVGNSLQTLNITTGGSILDNSAGGSSAAGAIYIGGDLVKFASISDGAVVERNRGSTGGFLYVGKMLRGEFKLANSSRISACSAKGSGGAIYVGDSMIGGLHISGGSSLDNNTAEGGDGGAVYAGLSVYNVTVDSGSSMSGNRAGGSGGGINVKQLLMSFVAKSGASVSGNRAQGNGR